MHPENESFLHHQEQVRSQPISAKEAQVILQKREETQHELNKQKQLYESNLQKLSELQMEHNKSVVNFVLLCILL